MKRLFAVLLCLAMVASLLPAGAVFAAEEAVQESSAQTDAQILKERRDRIYKEMMDMANVLWRATEDFTYYFATSKVTIVKGRLYRGMPYTHARGSLSSFKEFMGEPNEKGERELIGVTPEMFDGGSQHARLGNDCSGAVSLAYATVSATTKNVGSSTLTMKNGYLPIGPYKPDPETNTNDDAVVAENGLQVMFESYALTQYADIVTCSGHAMMVQSINVVRNEDGTINGDESTMTVVHQNPDPIRNNRYFGSGYYSEENYGEKVYRTFLIDDPKTFTWLYNNGYQPYTCIELIDPSPVAEMRITDTETEHNFKTLMSGTIKANRLIEKVTMTITDEEGNVVQKGTARGYRTDAKGTNYDMEYDLNQLRLESPQKIVGHLNPNQLGVGNYHCQLDIRVMTGETVEKVRDFDFTVTEKDLKEGWVDNSNLEFTEVDGKKMAVCPVCGGEPVEWQALPVLSGSKAMAAGHYYLAEDMSNKGRYVFDGSATTCVHLNGHDITSTSQVFRVANVDSVLNVMGNGNVMGGFTAEDTTEGATIHVSSGSGEVYLYGGNWGHSFGTTRPTIGMEAADPLVVIYSGATLCRMDDAQGANVEICSGRVELRGGRILDGTNTTGYGGNIRVCSSAKYTGKTSTFTMYDGIIAGGRAKYGGNVSVFRNDSTHGSKDRTFNMEGGLMHFGFAGYAASNVGYGGNIYTSGTIAKVNINGGTVTYGKSYSGGGNIYAANGTEVKIGGILENGNGDYGSKGSSGSNIYLIGSTTNSAMSKMTITGTVRNPMTAAGNGGNIFSSYADVIVDGGTISGGKATSRGGNIYITNTAGSLTVKNNGKIVDGTAPLGGNVGTNIAAVINVESGATITGGSSSTNGPDVLLYAAATVNVSGGKVGDFYGNTGKVSLSGDGSIENLNMSTGTLNVDPAWKGVADVNWGGKYVENGVLTKVTCGETILGKLTYTGGQPVISKDSKAYLALASAGDKAYLTVAEAQAALGENETLKLYTDAELTLDKDTYVDINGKNVTVTGEGKLYGIDSSNDDYNGYGTATVTGQVEKDVTDPATGNRYIALTDADGKVSFHRLNMRPTTVTLRPDDAGVYYKAQFDCDTVLADAVNKYGMIVSLDNMPGEDFLTEFWDVNRATVSAEPFAPGVVTTSGSIFGIMKDANSEFINNRNGQMKIYANAYLLLDDNTLLVADKTSGDKWNDPDFDGTAFSLQDVLQRIDDNWENYADAHDRILKFYKTWADKGMGSWQFANIK